VLAAGVRVVQYRSKSGIAHDVLARAWERTRSVGALLIVNDDPSAIDCADGVHLGQEDMALLDISALRARTQGKVVGISCPDVPSAYAALAAGADYIGVGAMYATRTKHDAGAPIGPEGVRAAVRAVGLPVAAIGGITLARIPEVRATGAAMAAVITAISRAPDRMAAARALVEAWAC